jgi:hypothetical protein
VRRDCEPHRGPHLQALGSLSVSLASVAGLTCLLPWVAIPAAVLAGGLGLAAWVLGRRDLRAMRAGRRDPAGRIRTQGGALYGLVGTVAAAVVLLAALALHYL